MASSDGATSFEAMIHADRARKKNEDLANQIFGRSKSSQNVNKKQNKQEPRSPSLASRMGVQKRSSSSSIPTQNKNPFNPPSRPSSTNPTQRNQQNNAMRANRMATEINSGNANITSSSSRNSSFRADRNGDTQSQSQQGAGPGFSIKGSAGPFTLLASNFDPGTTEADIEAALYSELFDEKGNNTLQSCRIINTRPMVVAEMVLTEKSVADKIIRKFHNLKADGRILKVVLQKSGSDGPIKSKGQSRGGSAVAQTIEQQPEALQESNVGVNVDEGDMEMDDAEVTADYPVTSAYDHEREAADRDRRDRDRNRDREDYAGSSRRDDRRDTDRPRDDRDRLRRDDRDRDENRERERDRERDRDREVRDPQPSHDRDREYERRDAYDSRPSQPRPQQPAYGNGFGRPPRGAYGYGNRGYGFPRGGGGYGGGRGSYRGY